MPTDLPPPGPERDAEIARLLGWPIVHEWGEEDAYAWMGERQCPWCRKRDHSTERERPSPCCAPSFSTSADACDRLTDEIERRGWVVWITYRSWLGESTRHQARCSKGGLVPIYANGTTHADAVSAAALLALRSSS